MISKELLSEVLGINIGTYYCDDQLYEDKYWVDDTQSTPYLVWNVMGQWHNIDIYELAHKCKEWAMNENYILSSETNPFGEGYVT